MCCGLLSWLLGAWSSKTHLYLEEVCDGYVVVHVNTVPEIVDGVYTSPSSDRMVHVVHREPLSFKYVLDPRWYPITEDQAKMFVSDYKAMPSWWHHDGHKN